MPSKRHICRYGHYEVKVLEEGGYEKGIRVKHTERGDVAASLPREEVELATCIAKTLNEADTNSDFDSTIFTDVIMLMDIER